MKRIFIGIPLGEDLKKKIADWRRPHEMLPVRWVPERNLHITLVPPWYEEDIAGVVARLEETVRGYPRFSVQFDCAELGPNKRLPRLIWAAGNASRKFVELGRKLADAFESGGERQDFLLHVTLARFRPEETEQIKFPQFAKPENWKMTAESVALFESILLPGGAEYRILGEVRLGG